MDIICTICWESLECGRILATTCGHIFHEKCIAIWALRSDCCPDCRTEPFFPMRIIHFIWQEQIDGQEMPSPDTSVHETSSSESDLPDRRSKSAQNIPSGSGFAPQSTAHSAGWQMSPANSQKSMEFELDQRSAGGDGGCGVCKRFHFLLEKAIRLRTLVKKYEKAHQTGSASATPANRLKLAECSDPEAKRQRLI